MKNKEKKTEELIATILCMVVVYGVSWLQTKFLMNCFGADKVLENARAIGMLSFFVFVLTLAATLYVFFNVIRKKDYPFIKYLKKAFVFTSIAQIIISSFSIIVVIVVIVVGPDDIQLIYNICAVVRLIVRFFAFLFAASSVNTTPEEYAEAQRRQAEFLAEYESRKQGKR